MKTKCDFKKDQTTLVKGPFKYRVIHFGGEGGSAILSQCYRGPEQDGFLHAVTRIKNLKSSLLKSSKIQEIFSVFNASSRIKIFSLYTNWFQARIKIVPILFLETKKESRIKIQLKDWSRSRNVYFMNRALNRNRHSVAQALIRNTMIMSNNYSKIQPMH